ncbi:hypothetical protein CGLO_18165 [Colletotrichum gloeosporioides Cg-14]|uniref:Uncharacterized protein n=1 Tax=Colletotrichum gloeosporioides (strain Cg-14) TaxID=1237896 RepID=T0L4N8_COLGC|nr:hypothetical protein CGLO_18165 [Colletotrichum gloeosporioides Cg-14]
MTPKPAENWANTAVCRVRDQQAHKKTAAS